MTRIDRLQILIVHPLEVVSELVRFRIESEYNCHVKVVTNLTSALQVLKETNYPIVLSALDIGGDSALVLFRSIIDSGKHQFFYLIENKKMIDPFTYNNQGPAQIFSEEHLLESLGRSLEKILTKAEDSPEAWTRVSLDPLTHFDGVPEDVYIQLRTGRFLKLFTRGDRVNRTDVVRYSRKGVTNLFLKKEAFNWLLSQIDVVMPVVINNPGKAIVVEAAEDNIVFNEECPNIDGPIKVPEDLINEVHQTSKKILLKMKKNKELAKILKLLNIDRQSNAFFTNRINLICNISCALAKELSWTSDAMLEKLIYIAHTHDVALISHPKLAKIQSKLELDIVLDLTEEEKQLILNHTKASAEIVMRDSRAPAEAELIIRQHHELPNGNGFPEGIQSVRILPTTALLEISIHLAQYIIENPQWNIESYLKLALPRFRGGHFSKILKALENVCRGKI